MAGGIVARQRDGSSQRGRPSSDAATGGPMPGPAWIPVALALTAFAGVLMVGAMRDRQLDSGGAGGRRRGSASLGEREVERSITIGKTADELHRRWRDSETLPQIMAGFATVRASGDGRMHWRVEGPLGRTFEWESETVDGPPGGGIGWRSLPGASISNEGSVRFRPAPADRGTIATLLLRFDPPGGALGDAAVELLGTTPLDLAVDGALRRFKSLVETGEIPTTERQPAARADTR